MKLDKKTNLNKTLPLPGNRCGHDPNNPKLTLLKPPKTGKGGIPLILHLASKAMQDFFANPALLPSLNYANNIPSQQRSERREACALIMQATLKYTDLDSLRVGIPFSSGFMHLTEEFLAKQAGIGLKRAQRAIGDLKKAGIITISTIRKKTPQGFKSYAALKHVSSQFFSAIGLGKMLKEQRNKALKRKTKKEPCNQQNHAKLNLLFKKILSKTTWKPQKKPTIQDLERTKKLHLKAFDLKRAHPNWNRDKCFQEAKKLIFAHSSED